jgi:hypothetical protein
MATFFKIVLIVTCTFTAPVAILTVLVTVVLLPLLTAAFQARVSKGAAQRKFAVEAAVCRHESSSLFDARSLLGLTWRVVHSQLLCHPHLT